MMASGSMSLGLTRKRALPGPCLLHKLMILSAFGSVLRSLDAHNLHWVFRLVWQSADTQCFSKQSSMVLHGTRKPPVHV